MNVETLLWPTDLSEASLKAAPQVQDVAEKYGARVLVLYVAVDLCSYFPAYGNYPSQDRIREFQSWEVEQAREKLETFCQKELKACPNLEVRLVQGDPAEAILQTAREENAQMIVMTTRGHGAAQGGRTDPGLGSVASKVIQQSPVSVISVNPGSPGQGEA